MLPRNFLLEIITDNYFNYEIKMANLLPGKSNGGWYNNEKRPFFAVIAGDAQRLYSLAKAHVICHEHPAFMMYGKTGQQFKRKSICIVYLPQNLFQTVIICIRTITQKLLQSLFATVYSPVNLRLAKSYSVHNSLAILDSHGPKKLIHLNLI